MWSNFKQKIHTKVSKKEIRSPRKKHVTWMCFKFWLTMKFSRKTQTYKTSIMVCLQNYREKLLFVNFRRLHSNSKVVSIIPWQNKYSDLKTTCHIKPKFLLCTKILENLLLAKYLVSVLAALKKFLSQSFHSIWVRDNLPKSSRKLNQRAVRFLKNNELWEKCQKFVYKICNKINTLK